MTASIRSLLEDKIVYPSNATAYEMVEVLLAAWEECHRDLRQTRETAAVWVRRCAAVEAERDEVRRQRDEIDRRWSDLAAVSREGIDAGFEWKDLAAELQTRLDASGSLVKDQGDSIRALEATISAAKEAIRGVRPLVATTPCFTRPAWKSEPWRGACGKCAACLATSALATLNAEAVSLEDAPARIGMAI